MELWWEIQVSLALAVLKAGTDFHILWWLRPFWTFVPLFIFYWAYDAISSDLRSPGYKLLPLSMLAGGAGAGLLSAGLSQISPCMLPEIQRISGLPPEFCFRDGRLPDIHASLWAIWISFSIIHSSRIQKIFSTAWLLIPALLSGISAVLLCQSFISDILSGWVWGILSTFVVQYIFTEKSDTSGNF